MSLVGAVAFAQVGRAQGLLEDYFAHQKVDALEGGFGGNLSADDEFGHALAAVGDLDGDGRSELVVGAPGTGSGSFSNGALWVLFLDAQGGVSFERRIANGQSGFVGPSNVNGCLGRSLAALGDFDGRGAFDLAVGEPQDCTLFAHDEGRVWLLFLGASGEVLGERALGEGLGGFGGALDDNDAFGHALANLGDLDGNGVVDLAVGAPGDDEGGLNRGAVWILFLEPDGSVGAQQKIASGTGGFAGALADGDEFGSAVAALGDWDSDGATELAVGAHRDSVGGPSRGAVWVLFLDPTGQVKSEVRIAEGAAGFGGTLVDKARFGTSLAALGDVDGDGWTDLAVGAEGTDSAGADLFTAPGRGAVWLLFLEPAGTVQAHRYVASNSGGFVDYLGPRDRFGSALAALPNLDGGTAPDLAVGAWGDALDAEDQGAVWTLFPDTLPPGQSEELGCGTNPSGSLLDLGDVPAPGNTVVLGVDNPLGTQDAGALPFVLASTAPLPGWAPFESPCGLLVPGWGMQGPGAAGELLLDVGALAAPAFAGAPWSTPGVAVPVALPIPANTALVGFRVYVQGLLLDGGGLSGVPIALTSSRELLIGA